MNRVYVVSDTHFGYQKTVTFRPFATVEEHDRELVARWNAVVRPKDTVWHLGDVFFGGRDNHAILGELHGIKRLVLGNHDVYPIEVYQRYFTKIYGAAKLHGCALTHIPVHPCQLESRFKLNIHGHLHSAKLDDPRYVCVSVEQTNFTPVLLKEIVEGTNDGGSEGNSGDGE